MSFSGCFLDFRELAKDFVVSGTASESLYGACESMYKPNMVTYYFEALGLTVCVLPNLNWIHVANGSLMKYARRTLEITLVILTVLVLKGASELVQKPDLENFLCFICIFWNMKS